MLLCGIVLYSIGLSPPDISTDGCHFFFVPASSFFLELLVISPCSSLVAYWTVSNFGGHLLLSYLFFCNFILLMGFSWQEYWSDLLFLLHTFCLKSSLLPVHLRWPCMEWLIASLSYTSPFATT